MSSLAITSIDRLELTTTPDRWKWADANKTAIDAHFSLLRTANPGQDLWNGCVLLLRRASICRSAFRGEFFSTNYASLACWRDQGYPDPVVKCCVGMCALRSADGAYVLGVMSKLTANPGAIYFAA